MNTQGQAQRRNLDELQMDALKELGNVGASHASGALSNLVSKDILIDVAECTFLPMQAMHSRFGRPGDVLALIAIDVRATGRSRIVITFPKNVATELSDLMMQRPVQLPRKLTVEDKEALIEMGDFCIREYLNPISRFLKVDFMPTPPLATFDVIGTNMGVPEKVGLLANGYDVKVDANFVDSAGNFQGAITYLPDLETQMMAFKKFGVDDASLNDTFNRFGVK